MLAAEPMLVPDAVAPLNHAKLNPAPPALASIDPFGVPPAQLVDGVGVMVTVGDTVVFRISTVTGVDVQFKRVLVTVAVYRPPFCPGSRLAFCPDIGEVRVEPVLQTKVYESPPNLLGSEVMVPVAEPLKPMAGSQMEFGEEVRLRTGTILLEASGVVVVFSHPVPEFLTNTV